MSELGKKSPVLHTLGSQALPRRVRDLLKSSLKIAADELERGINMAAREFEQQLHQQVEQAMEKVDRDRWQQARQLAEGSRAELLLYFLNALEAEFANLKDPQIIRGHLQAGFRSGAEMALVNDLEIEETSTLTDSASRAELQASLQLFLLGQRFGVLAGQPAFDVETMPVGPQALCRSIRSSVERLGFPVEARLLFYRAFDRQVMPLFGTLVEAINDNLARNGVLPQLQYVPIRARRTEQIPGSFNSLAEIAEHGLSLDETNAERTARADLRNWLAGSNSSGGPGAKGVSAQQATELLLAMASGQSGYLASEPGFNLLRQLNASRRQLLGKLNPDRTREGREAPHEVGLNELQEALMRLQSRPASPVLSHGRMAARNVGHIRQDMLAMLRRISPDQEAPVLADEQSDVLDLIGMLYDNLMKDVKPGSTASSLLTKLQVPLMRVALQDSGFFTQPEHPARQMLGTIAETSAHWLGENDSDGSLANQMNNIIDRAVRDYKGNPDVFSNVLQELITHLQTLSRKAEVAERRHVEAARGKEKLTLAREHASKCVDALIKNQKLPRFTRTMLNHAWTDVMALTALRQGEDSPDWQRQLQVAERLIQVAQHPDDNHPDTLDPELNLQHEIEEGLAKVGYQSDDVSAIAHRLIHPNDATKGDFGSRTELTVRLKAQARLGEELPGKSARRIPLTSAEAAQMQRLMQAPVGTWFEFVTNPQGDRVRRRLAWLSMTTGAALFVNQRGQKNAEYTLDSLARLLAKGQVSFVDDQQGTIIDRAWDNVLLALKSFAVPEQAPENPQ